VLQPAQNKGLDEAALRKAIGMLGGTGLQVQRLDVNTHMQYTNRLDVYIYIIYMLCVCVCVCVCVCLCVCVCVYRWSVWK
jgi:hypothetical protein